MCTIEIFESAWLCSTHNQAFTTAVAAAEHWQIEHPDWPGFSQERKSLP